MLAILLALSSAATTAPSPEGDRAPLVVLLRPSVEIRTPEYYLRDIAELHGGELVYRTAAAATRIGYAPLPGRERRVSAQWVRDRLARDGLPRGSYRVAGAPLAVITPAVTTWSAAEIETRARTFLEGRLRAAGSADFLLELRAEVRPLAISAASEGVELKARFSGLPRVRGPVTIAVEARAAGHTLGAALVRYQIRSFEQRLVVTRPVYRGQALDASNTALRRVETTRHAPLEPATTEAGRRLASRNLAPGEVLHRTDQRVEQVVRRGQSVTVLARCGRIQVSHQGIARGNGALGDRIEVEGVDERGRRTNRRVFGIVKAAGIVEVEVR